MADPATAPVTEPVPESARGRSARFFVNDTGTTRRPIDLFLAIAGAVIALLSTVATSSEGGPPDLGLIGVAADLPG